MAKATNITCDLCKESINLDAGETFLSLNLGISWGSYVPHLTYPAHARPEVSKKQLTLYPIPHSTKELCIPCATKAGVVSEGSDEKPPAAADVLVDLLRDIAVEVFEEGA